MADNVTPAAMRQAELMRKFTEFLDADDGRGSLSMRIKDMVAVPDEGVLRAGSGEAPRRLVVSVDDLRSFDSTLADDVLNNPVDHLPVFERAMQDLIAGERPDLSADRRKLSEYRIGLEGSFGARCVSPRGLGARLVGGVVSADGIVTRASNIRPRLVLSVHYCPRTGKFHEKMYRDNASVSSLAVFTQNAGMPGSSYPTKDEDGNALETEFGKCWYRDSQRITIQEMPESAPAGQLPRSVEVLIEGDLCDACKPGDRVRISGIFRAVGGAASTGGTGIFKTFVVATHIMLLTGAEGRTAVDGSIHDEDIRNIIEYAEKDHVFTRMSRSIAPSICGHEYIKKALLLLLIGGKEQNLANGTHLRGDINVLMVGDPSTAKSQLLRFIMNTAPLAISTTGRGSSGVGLTAAVTTDQDTGDRHLEAGAMVLADRGVVCIDEFDKMSDEDRVAIHEVMEQQTVTIAKAGIHASLNARCSVVAAANPVYGSYDKHRKPHENIALPDSLLSRFDLLFIVLDSADKERDRQIADHVLRGHRFRKNTHTLDEVDDGVSRARVAGGANAGATNSGPTPMYENAASALYRSMDEGARAGRRRSARNADKQENKILSMNFLKMYINYAKHRANPTLTQDAAEHISLAYRNLRQDLDSSKTLPITARCLETLIRLATAHAKCRLDKSFVTVDDAIAAVEVLRFALFNQAEPDKSEKVFKKRTRKAAKKSKTANPAAADTDDDSDSDDDEAGAGNGAARSDPIENDTMPDTEETGDLSLTRPSSRRSAGAQGGSGSGLRTQDSTHGSGGSAAVATDLVGSETAAVVTSGVEPSNEDVATVTRVKAGINALRGRNKGFVEIDALISWLAEEDVEDAEPLTERQVQAALDKMQADDEVVIADSNIFIV